MAKKAKQSRKTGHSKFENQSHLYEVVRPLGNNNDAGPDGLYDGCPLCEMLRMEIEMGYAVPMQEPQSDLNVN